MAKTAPGLVFLAFFFLTGCNRAGQTPLEQRPLETLSGPIDAPIYLTVQEFPIAAEPLVRVVREFERHRLEVVVVWQMRQSPTTEMLAAFSGKGFRQYLDPQGFMKGTGVQVSVRGKPVPLADIPLRIAFARLVLR